MPFPLDKSKIAAAAKAIRAKREEAGMGTCDDCGSATKDGVCPKCGDDEEAEGEED